MHRGQHALKPQGSRGRVSARSREVGMDLLPQTRLMVEVVTGTGSRYQACCQKRTGPSKAFLSRFFTPELGETLCGTTHTNSSKDRRRCGGGGSRLEVVCCLLEIR